MKHDFAKGDIVSVQYGSRHDWADLYEIVSFVTGWSQEGGHEACVDLRPFPNGKTLRTTVAVQFLRLAPLENLARQA